MGAIQRRDLRLHFRVQCVHAGHRAFELDPEILNRDFQAKEPVTFGGVVFGGHYAAPALWLSMKAFRSFTS
jgi:hypothetical protein